MIYAPGFSVTKGRGTTGLGQQEEKGKVRRGRVGDRRGPFSFS